MRFQSNKHWEIVNLIAKLTNGKTTDNVPLKKGEHNPDIILPDMDVEVEMLVTSNLRRKCKRYDKKRKRIMVIAIPDEIKDYFDDIFLLKL